MPSNTLLHVSKLTGISAYHLKKWYEDGRIPDPTTTPMHVLLQSTRALLVAGRLHDANRTAADALINPKFIRPAVGHRGASLVHPDTHPVNGITPAALHHADPLPPSDPASLYHYLLSLTVSGRLLPLTPGLYTDVAPVDIHAALCDLSPSDPSRLLAGRYHVQDLITALDSYASGINADDPDHPLPVQPQKLLPWYNPTEIITANDDGGISYAPTPSDNPIPTHRTPLRTAPPLTITSKRTCTAAIALSYFTPRLHAPLSHTVFTARNNRIPSDPTDAADCYPLPRSRSASRTWYTRTDTLPGTSLFPMRLRHPARTVRTVVSVTAPTSPDQQPQPVLWYRLDYTTKHYLVHLTLLPAQPDQSDIHLPPVRVYGHGTTARAALYRAVLNLGITSPPPLGTSQRAHIALTLIWLARWLTGSAQTVLTGDDPDAHPAPSSSPDN